MPRYVRLYSGLERAAEIAEQNPAAVAAIVEMLDLFTEPPSSSSATELGHEPTSSMGEAPELPRKPKAGNLPRAQK